MQPLSSPRGVAPPGLLKKREIAGLTFTVCAYPPGLRMPKHAHEPAFLSLVLRGSYTETIGKAEFCGKPAALLAHPPHNAHTVIFHDQEVRIFRTEIKERRWFERLRECSVVFEDPACFDGGLTVYLAQRLYKEFCAPDKYSTLAVEGLLLEMLAEISRGEKQRTPSNLPHWLKRAREMLHEEAETIPTLAELAIEVGVHPVYLAHQFRKFFRVSIGEYTRRLRIEAACRALAQTELALSEIAVNAGFYDQSHFSNSFKRHTGMTPADFRSITRTHY